MKRIITYFAIVCFLMSFKASSNDPVYDIVNKFKNIEKNKGAEKLFLHLDRPLYFSGDDIWFQSYLVSAASHLPITFERVLYVELINPMGVTVTKRMFKLDKGKCNGHLLLDADLTAGKYLVLAYTNWMRNQGAEFFFKKEIKILTEKEDEKNTLSADSGLDSDGAITKDSTTKASAQAHLQLSFMPEGGELISGTKSRVAFEGMNQAGKAMNFSGSIVDEDNNFHSIIRPLYDGKGFFIFSPKAGKKYKAIVTGNQGEELVFDLPQVKNQGYSLTVENRWKKDSLHVTVNSAGLDASSKIILVSQQDGSIMDVIQGRLGQGSIHFRLGKGNYRTGIVQLTLFNEQMVPQCERLVFVNRNEQLKIEVSGLNDINRSRDKIELGLEVRDENGNPVKGDFSLSVTDANMVGDDAYGSDNLVNHIFLSSNLPGKINNPGFYFQGNSTAHTALDLLMLVNGWRRFKWKEVLVDSIPKPPYALERGIFVEGQLKRKSSGKAAPKGIEVTMMLSGQGMDVYSAETDEGGKFGFAVRDFNDTVDVLVQTRNRLNNKADFSIDLESNLRFEPTDLNARELMGVMGDIPTTFYSSEKLKEGEVQAVKGNMREQYQRLAKQGFFQDTTDILMDDIDIKGAKKKSSQEEMAEEYGVPSYVIGQRQIEDLVKDKPWYDGLVTLLYDAIPGLRVYTRPVYENNKGTETSLGMDSSEMDSLMSEVGEFESLNDDQTVEFSLTGKSAHRFYIFVDSELVGLTDDMGVMAVMNNSLSFDDFIQMDPLAIKSIELIMNPRESPLLRMFYDSAEDIDMTGGPEAILAIYTKGGTGIFSRSYNKGMANFRLYGFEKVREFYSPKYDGTDDNKFIRDERATLLWNPTVKTDSLGKAHIELYNSDVATKLRVDVAGFSNSGIPGAAIVVKGTDAVKESVTDEKASTDEIKFDQEYTEELTSPVNTNLFAGTIFLDGKKASAYSTILVKGKSWSTISNAQGAFIIDKEKVDDDDMLEISIPGVGTTSLSFAQLLKDEGKVGINKTNAVFEKGVDGNKLVQQMLRKKRLAMQTKTHYIKGVYREKVIKGRDLYRLSDFSVLQKREGYNFSTVPHETMPLQGREYQTEDYRMQIKNEALNTLDDMIPLLDPLYKDLSFLNLEYKKQYDYRFVGYAKYQGREMYKIVFDQKTEVRKAFYQGTMLIDKETLGMAFIQWKLSEKGKKYEIPQMFLMPSEKMEDFESLKENNEATYLLEDGVWKLKIAVQQLEVKINNTKISFDREFIVTEHLSEKPEDFKSRIREDMDRRRTLIKDVNYKPEFWREAWCLPSDSYTKEQIKHLHEVTFYK